MSYDIEAELRAAAQRNGRPSSTRAAGGFVRRALDDGLIDVAYSTTPSPVGDLLVASTKKGLVKVSFLGFRTQDEVLQRIADRVSPRIMEAPERVDDIRRELDEYFDGKRKQFDVPLDWSLVTGFQSKILDATTRIPYGQHLSYKEVATKAGNPNASRAAGNALGANPIPIVVPCHRVWATGGQLGGYTGGVDRKRVLLELEGSLQPELGL